MKKTVLVILSLILSSVVFSQKIKLFESYLRLNDLSTRYVVVLEDNSIWWFAPEQPWEKSSVKGLPNEYKIKQISCYSKEDGESRYVVVLEDNSIWWLAPGQPWEKSSVEGLPNQYKIKQLEAYSKTDGTRYVVVLEDNSIWWLAPGQPWKKSSTDGLPE
jgi:hypothetical protein